MDPDDETPPGADLEPWGNWYSFPASAKCELGDALGHNGCSWKLREGAYARVVAVRDLWDHGFDSPVNKTHPTDIDRHRAATNVPFFLRAFDQVASDLKPQSC